MFAASLVRTASRYDRIGKSKRGDCSHSCGLNGEPNERLDEQWNFCDRRHTAENWIERDKIFTATWSQILRNGSKAARAARLQTPKSLCDHTHEVIELAMDRYAAMTVFTRVVESGSFTAAARHCGMSPAMVSTHIRTLEKRLGVRLLNRTTRHVSATEVGQNYYERCLRILYEVEDAERAAGDLQTAPRGRLRLTAPMTFGIRQLGPLIAAYLKVYPDVSIELSLDDRKIDLLGEGFDLAICVGRLADSRLVARRVTLAPVVLCASRDYVGKYGAPKVPQDLVRHNCLVYANAHPRSEWSFLGQDGAEEAVRISGRFVANNGDALRQLALEGLGIILAPEFIVAEDLNAGRLVALMPDYKAVPLPFHAVYPHGRYLSAKVRTFVDFLATWLDKPARPRITQRADERETRPLQAFR